MDPTWNPACFVNHCFDSNETLPDKTASAFLQSSRAVDIHYGAWLERRRWATIANDPDRLPEYILASYLSETVDIVQLARDIPLIGRVVPDKKWILLPARIIAMARLCVDCQKQHQFIRIKKERYATTMPTTRSFGQCFSEGVDNSTFFGTFKIEPSKIRTQPAAVDHNTRQLHPLIGIPFAMALFTEVGIEATIRGTGSYMKDQITDTLHPALDLTMEYHELAMRYVHLYKTAQGDEYAVKDALLRMPEHLEVLDSEGMLVLEKIIEYGVWGATEQKTDLRFSDSWITQ